MKKATVMTYQPSTAEATNFNGKFEKASTAKGQAAKPGKVKKTTTAAAPVGGSRKHCPCNEDQ